MLFIESFGTRKKKDQKYDLCISTREKKELWNILYWIDNFMRISWGCSEIPFLHADHCERNYKLIITSKTHAMDNTIRLKHRINYLFWKNLVCLGKNPLVFLFMNILSMELIKQRKIQKEFQYPPGPFSSLYSNNNCSPRQIPKNGRSLSMYLQSASANLNDNEHE